MKPVSIITLALCAVLTACSPSSSPRKTPAQEAADKRHQKAVELFSERCKIAGERIHRTVDNVDGIFLMKIRPKETNYSDQFAMTDPYGDDSGGETYIKTFFSGFYRIPESPPPGWKRRLGYAYVEAIDPQDGRRYRYTGSVKEVTRTTSIMMGGDGKTTFTTKEFVLDKTLATGPQPRYGVTYDDISTREEREYWIAGSSLKVIDLKTNEVIAERVGYMMDPGQGSLGAGSGRSPWLMATYHACPSFPMAPGGNPVHTDQTRNFVTKILNPEPSN